VNTWQKPVILNNCRIKALILLYKISMPGVVSNHPIYRAIYVLRTVTSSISVF
jgi:hypothetical protein